MNRALILLFIHFVLVGCAGKDHSVQIKRMYQKQISLDVISDIDSLGKVPKVIVYHDSNQCSTCQLGHISDWDEIIWHLDSLRPAIPVYFIITPPQKRTKEIIQYLHNLKLQRYHITIDSLNLFSKHNPVIPADNLLHTFLLDRDNRIVLIGAPLFNTKLWSIYKNITQKMNDNNGLLPIDLK